MKKIKNGSNGIGKPLKEWRHIDRGPRMIGTKKGVVGKR
jgi:hypothetical protein